MSLSGLKPRMASQAYETLERQMMEITNPKQLKDQLVSLCREIQELVRESECMDKILGRQVHALSKAENVGDAAVTQKLDLLRAELAQVTSEEKDLTEQVRAIKRTAAKKGQEVKRIRTEAGNAIKVDGIDRFPVTLAEVEAFLLQRPDVSKAEINEGIEFLCKEHESLKAVIEQYISAKAEAESEVHGELTELGRKLAKLNRERAKLTMDIEKQLHWIHILTIRLRSVRRAAQAPAKSPQARKSVTSPDDPVDIGVGKGPVRAKKIPVR